MDDWIAPGALRKKLTKSTNVTAGIAEGASACLCADHCGIRVAIVRRIGVPSACTGGCAEAIRAVAITPAAHTDTARNEAHAPKKSQIAPTITGARKVP